MKFIKNTSDFALDLVAKGVASVVMMALLSKVGLSKIQNTKRRRPNSTGADHAGCEAKRSTRGRVF